MRYAFSALFVALIQSTAFAATPQTTVLDVKNRTCGQCPATVKKSLDKVFGVSQARVDFKKKTATVTFDADRTGTVALVKGTTKVGFPSEVRK